MTVARGWPARAGALLLGARVLAAASLGGCGSGSTVHAATALPVSGAVAPAAPAGARLPRTVRGGRTAVQFAHVDFHVAPGVVLEIRHLRGEMANRSGDGPVVLDDKRSFVIRIASAEVALDTTSLAHLMNDHVFGYTGSPLRRLTFATQAGQLVQRGRLHKVVDIPFQLTASVSVTPDGLIRIHPTAMRIFSVPGKGLMQALGVTLDDLLDLRRAHGVRAEGDDLLLDPDQLLPPPAISGRLRAVRVEPGRLIQTFGDGAADGRPEPVAPSDGHAPNYIAFRGGTLRFGKLLMVDADLQIVDLEPADPFEFSVDRYAEQLVAGYSRSRPDLGLEVFMPDLTRLRHRTAGTTAVPEPHP